MQRLVRVKFCLCRLAFCDSDSRADQQRGDQLPARRHRDCGIGQLPGQTNRLVPKRLRQN